MPYPKLRRNKFNIYMLGVYRPSTYLPIYLSTYLSIYHLSIHPPIFFIIVYVGDLEQIHSY